MGATVMDRTEQRVGHVSQIPKGEGRNFDLGGLRVAVFHMHDGAVFATQPDCPHLGGPLADGLTGVNTVMCPLHDRLYDLRSGAGLNTDCQIKVYPTRVSGDGEIWLVVPAR